MYLILLGAPGSGKGTQGAILAQRLGVPKVATGDLLREAVKQETALGKEAESYMTAGLLVPDEVILGLIEEVLQSPEAADGIVMDGFPRTVAQAEAVDRLLEARRARVDGVIVFDVAQDELVTRMLGRAREQGRGDDTPDAIRKRLEVFVEETAPLNAYYEERGIVHRISGVGTILDVARRVREAVGA